MNVILVYLQPLRHVHCNNTMVVLLHSASTLSCASCPKCSTRICLPDRLPQCGRRKRHTMSVFLLAAANAGSAITFSVSGACDLNRFQAQDGRDDVDDSSSKASRSGRGRVFAMGPCTHHSPFFSWETCISASLQPHQAKVNGRGPSLSLRLLLCSSRRLLPWSPPPTCLLPSARPLLISRFATSHQPTHPLQSSR